MTNESLMTFNCVNKTSIYLYKWSRDHVTKARRDTDEDIKSGHVFCMVTMVIESLEGDFTC